MITEDGLALNGLLLAKIPGNWGKITHAREDPEEVGIRNPLRRQEIFRVARSPIESHQNLKHLPVDFRVARSDQPI